MSGIELQVADRFPAGTKVGAYPAVHDTFTPGQTEAVTTATVGKNGVLKLSGLVEHGPYHLAAEVDDVVPTPQGNVEVKVWRSLAITASNPAPGHDREATNAQAAAEAQARQDVLNKTTIDTATAPAGGPQIVVGARGTENSKPGHPISRQIPHPRIEDQKAGTPLRSHTETGEAHPVPDDEAIPTARQEDEDGPQASSTETGEATPVEQPESSAPKRKPSARKGGAKKKAAKKRK